MLKASLVLGVLGLAGLAAAGAEPLVSGPQPGEKVPGPFKPLNANGPDAGKEECLYCKSGSKPVVMVFARELTPGVVELIKRLDAATNSHRESGLATCVIVLSDGKDLAASLGKWAQGEKITNTVLATYAPAGPAKYGLSADAAVTVLLYHKQTVKANHAFAAGALKEPGLNAVMADLSKILPRE